MKIHRISAENLCPERAYIGAYAPILQAIFSLPVLTTEQFLERGEAIELPPWAKTTTLRVLTSKARYASPSKARAASRHEPFTLSIFRDSESLSHYAWRRKDD